MISFLTIVGICTSCYDVFERDISGEQVALQAPAENAIADSLVTFWWNPLPGAAQYRLRILSPSLDSAVFQFLDTILTTTTYQTELPGGKYQWCVQGLNAGYETQVSCRYITSTLDVIDISSAQITLQEPADEMAVSSEDTVLLRWNMLHGASRFRVRISSLENDTENIFRDEVISVNSYKVRLPEGNYHWCVQGLNAVYKTSMACRSIESVRDITAASVVLLEPVDAFTSEASDSVSFKWEEIEGSSQYRLRVATPDMDNVVTMLVDTLLGNVTYKALFPEGHYEWCVQGVNSKYETGNNCRMIEITP